MRRSTFVYAPIPAAAALSTIGHNAAAQQSVAATQPSATTTREGFGDSFREHPWLWVLGTTWAGWMIFGPGS